MSRRPVLPTCRKHNQSGQGIVTFRLPSGKKKDYLLGIYGSKASKAEYARLLGEFQAGRGTMPGPSGQSSHLTINELFARYLSSSGARPRN